MLDIKPKIKQEYIFIAIIILLAASSFFLFFKTCQPNIMLYRASLRQIREKEQELKIRKLIMQQIERLKEEISKTDEEYNNFTKKIILQAGTFEAVKVITDIAKGLKIEFLSIQPLDRKKVELAAAETDKFSKISREEGKDFFIWEIPVSMKIRAKYADLLEFIKKIENDQRFLKVKNMSIKKNKDTPLVHNAEFTISMYSLSGEETIKTNEKK